MKGNGEKEVVFVEVKRILKNLEKFYGSNCKYYSYQGISTQKNEVLTTFSTSTLFLQRYLTESIEKNKINDEENTKTNSQSQRQIKIQLNLIQKIISLLIQRGRTIELNFQEGTTSFYLLTLSIL